VLGYITSRVSDPYSFDTDPDPGFLRPKIEKNQLKKNYIFYLQKKTSALKREHLALQNMKFLKKILLLWVILPSWIRIRITNTDPDLRT
jgi:hypothetical protein